MADTIIAAGNIRFRILLARNMAAYASDCGNESSECYTDCDSDLSSSSKATSQSSGSELYIEEIVEENGERETVLVEVPAGPATPASHGMNSPAQVTVQ